MSKEAIKDVCIGIPAYKAYGTLPTLLSSIRIQSFKDRIHVVICNDDPDGDDYTNIIKQFPDLYVTEVRNEVNGGPGVSRDHCLKACKEPWITWIDADDRFYTPYSIELMYYKAINPEPNTRTILVETTFVQECSVKQNDGVHKMLVPIQHPCPWMFGKLYSTEFLKANKIDTGSLRAMEDSTIQYQCRMLTEGTPLKIQRINDITYVWSEGSEHSITRVGADINDGVPLYNFGNCMLGSILSTKYAIKKVLSVSPFNVNCSKFAVEQFVGLYFTIAEAIEKKSIYIEQLKWLATWAYQHLLKAYAPTVPFDALSQMYFAMLKAKNLNKQPEQSFKDWFEEVSTKELRIEEIDEIHNRLSEEVRKAEESTGVFKEALSITFRNMEGYTL